MTRTRVRSPTATVSFQVPDSQGSRGRGRPVIMSMRLSTWNITRCMWKGCIMPVALVNSQISVWPSIGRSVMSSQCLPRTWFCASRERIRHMPPAQGSATHSAWR